MLSLLGVEKCASSVEIEQRAVHFPLVKVTARRLEPDCGSDAPGLQRLEAGSADQPFGGCRRHVVVSCVEEDDPRLSVRFARKRRGSERACLQVPVCAARSAPSFAPTTRRK
jgi:hypothetical protein